MAPSVSSALCVCPECSTTQVINQFNQQSVPGRYWKKSSVTYRQHLQELQQNISARGPSGSTPSIVHVNDSEVAQETRKIDIVTPKLEASDQNFGDVGRKRPNSPLNHPKSQLLHLPAQILGAILLSVCQYLFLHLSIAATNSTLQVLREITALDRSNNHFQPSFPITIKTILLHLDITPQIKKRICCPKCFCLYPADNKLGCCSFRATPRSHLCQTPLSVSSHQRGDKTNTRPGEFAYQSLVEWLARFLNRPGIEEQLEKSVNHISPNGVMEDIWDSPRWKEYKDSQGGQFTRRSNNLVFSLNVDWFNPSGNKIAGKHWSVGTIAMTCLNLPPLIRNQPENIFLAGLIPGPSEPKLEQINHLLQPLVSELLSLWKGCLIRPTLTSPIDGRIIRVRLGPVICDLPAIRKVLGMAGHSSANHLCSFCNVSKKKLDVVDINRFNLRSGDELRYHCLRWKNAKKVSRRERIFKRHGVRYSVLLQLPYFNLLDDAVVEPMHNIFLGLLRNHGTEFFGLKKKEGWNNNQSDSEVFDRLEHQENMSDVDYNANDSDTDSSSGGTNCSSSTQPMAFAPLNNENRTHLETMHLFEAFEDLTLFESKLEGIPARQVLQNNTDLQAHPNADSHSNVHGYNQVDSPLFAIPDNLQHLCTVIDEIRLPSHIGRVPATVGQAKGGKLKAEEWINLFSLLLIPTFFLIMKTNSSPHEDINSQFSNLLQLVSITSLVRQNKIIREDIDSLEEHLKVYRQGILRLYPQFTTKPNHHLALHLPKNILHMGPAPYWTAWAFERLNGSLARIPTNNQISKLNSTLLVKWATAQNFRGILPSLASQLPQGLCNTIEGLSNCFKNSYSTNSDGFTTDTNISNQSSLTMDSGISNQSKFNKTTELKHEDHLRLLKRLVEIDGHDIVGPEDKFSNWQKPINSPVLTRLVKSKSKLSFGNFNFATRVTHPGNSTIHYLFQNGRKQSKVRYGQIIGIISVSYQHELKGPFVTETWLDVASFDKLSSADKKKNPLIHWPHTHTHVTYQSQTTRNFVKPNEVLAQSTLWEAPCGTLGIKLPISILTKIKNHL